MKAGPKYRASQAEGIRQTDGDELPFEVSRPPCGSDLEHHRHGIVEGCALCMLFRSARSAVYSGQPVARAKEGP